jgi:xanthine dehydrogenase YagS FAD-binding subunit
MKPFHYVQSSAVEEATRHVSRAEGSVFFAGGTTLIDLMKIHVLQPSELVDVNRLPLSAIEVSEKSIRIGANVRNSELAWHLAIRERFPVLSEALLSGASTQIRNMATTAGNIMQKTRCPYYRDVSSACNKRVPGSGCDAIQGYNRGHAVLGTSDKCIAMFPSDMCTALAMMDTTVITVKPDGSTRRIAFTDFHLVPGKTPQRETILDHGEMISHIELTDLPATRNSHYLKVRDRASYEFALASAAVGLELDGQTIRNARVGLGGMATRPWRSPEAEKALIGKPANAATFKAAAEAALASAKTYEHNAFKVPLAKRTLIEALEELMAKQKGK